MNISSILNMHYRLKLFLHIEMASHGECSTWSPVCILSLQNMVFLCCTSTRYCHEIQFSSLIIPTERWRKWSVNDRGSWVAQVCSIGVRGHESWIHIFFLNHHYAQFPHVAESVFMGRCVGRSLLLILPVTFILGSQNNELVTTGMWWKSFLRRQPCTHWHSNCSALV